MHNNIDESRNVETTYIIKWWKFFILNNILIIIGLEIFLHPVTGLPASLSLAVTCWRGRRHRQVQVHACIHALQEMISKPTPEADVNGVDLFMLMHNGNYYRVHAMVDPG